MKRFYQMGLIVAVISVLSFVSCGVHSKNSYLKEFKSFVDKVENTDFETEADWNEALKEYERFTTTYYEEYKDMKTPEIAKLVRQRIIARMADFAVDAG